MFRNKHQRLNAYQIEPPGIHDGKTLLATQTTLKNCPYSLRTSPFIYTYSNQQIVY